MDLSSIFLKKKDEGAETPDSSSTVARISSNASPPSSRRSFLKESSSRSATASTSSGSTRSTSSAGRSAPDPTFLQEFESKLLEAKNRGCDAFLAQRKILSAFVTDDDKLTVAALNSAAQACGLTPNQILSSVRECVGIVENHYKDLTTQLENEAREGVQDKSQRVSDIAAEITRMQREIAVLETEKQNLESAIGGVDAEKHVVLARISSAYTALSTQLSAMVESISKNV